MKYLHYLYLAVALTFVVSGLLWRLLTLRNQAGSILKGILIPDLRLSILLPIVSMLVDALIGSFVKQMPFPLLTGICGLFLLTIGIINVPRLPALSKARLQSLSDRDRDLQYAISSVWGNLFMGVVILVLAFQSKIEPILIKLFTHFQA